MWYTIWKVFSGVYYKSHQKKWRRSQIELTSAQNEKIKTFKIFLFLVQIGYVPQL